MDMRAVSSVADYFVVCNAASTTRVKAIAEEIEKDLRKNGVRHWHIEGKREALWVVADYGDVLAHIFYKDMREFYNLERPWHDVPKEHFSEHRLAQIIRRFSQIAVGISVYICVQSAPICVQ